MSLAKCLSVLSIFSKYMASLVAQVGKESACNVGDPGSIPGSGRSPGEGLGYPFQYSWASLVTQLLSVGDLVSKYRLLISLFFSILLLWVFFFFWSPFISPLIVILPFCWLWALLLLLFLISSGCLFETFLVSWGRFVSLKTYLLGLFLLHAIGFGELCFYFHLSWAIFWFPPWFLHWLIGFLVANWFLVSYSN